MLRCIDQSAASAVEIFFDVDRHRRGLAGRQIVTPDVSGLLEHDRLLADRWQLDVEIGEMRELLCLLCCRIDNEEVHSGVTIRYTIYFDVRSVYRLYVLLWIAVQEYRLRVLEIVETPVWVHCGAVMI